MPSRLVLPREPSPPPPLLSWPPLASSCVSGGHSCAWRMHVPVHAASWQAPPAPVSPSIVSMPPFPGVKFLVLIELQRGASLCTNHSAHLFCRAVHIPLFKDSWRFLWYNHLSCLRMALHLLWCARGVCGAACESESCCTEQQYTEHHTKLLAKPACCSRLTACKLVKVEAWNVEQWMSVNALYGGMPSCCAVCVLCVIMRSCMSHH